MSKRPGLASSKPICVHGTEGPDIRFIPFTKLSGLVSFNNPSRSRFLKNKLTTSRDFWGECLWSLGTASYLLVQAVDSKHIPRECWEHPSQIIRCLSSETTHCLRFSSHPSPSIDLVKIWWCLNSISFALESANNWAVIFVPGGITNCVAFSFSLNRSLKTTSFLFPSFYLFFILFKLKYGWFAMLC